MYDALCQGYSGKDEYIVPHHFERETEMCPNSHGICKDCLAKYKRDNLVEKIIKMRISEKGIDKLVG